MIWTASQVTNNISVNIFTVNVLHTLLYQTSNLIGRQLLLKVQIFTVELECF